MNSWTIVRRRMTTITAAATALVGGCSAPAASPAASSGVGQLVLSADVNGTSIDSMVVTATASDLHDPLVFGLSRHDSQILGVLGVPSGAGRALAVSAIDSGGSSIYRGSVTLNVVPGRNPAVTVPLKSQAGIVTVTATLGPVALVVVPSSNTAALHAGQTFQLQAVITAPNGDVLAGPPAWATSNPSIATVSPGGVVTALAVGTVDIVSTYDGVAARATLTITP